MSENVIEINDGNFDAEVLKSDKPVMIDFWAEWCMPCKMIAPYVDEVAKNNADVIKVGKVNVDTSPSIASRYGVRSIPTLMFFKKGEVSEKVVGAVSKDAIQGYVDKVK